MGKPQAQGSQWKSRKDGFFVGKKQGKPRNKPAGSFGPSFDKTRKEEPFSKESAANSGSFFVSSSEKEQILHERQAKKSENFRFKPGRENAPNVKSKDSGAKFKHERKQINTRSKDGAGDEKSDKKFDKRKWRLQKYSKKYKLQQWEEKRKKTVLHQYYKQIQDDEPKFDVQKIYEEYKDDDGDDEDNEYSDNKEEEIENENNLNRDITLERSSTREPQVEPQASTSQVRKKKAFKKAHLEYQRIQDEKRKRKEDLEKKKVERAEALKEYKKQKLEKYKKLNKKTKKGQPIMKYRMEMLLEQIQKSVQ